MSNFRSIEVLCIWVAMRSDWGFGIRVLELSDTAALFGISLHRYKGKLVFEVTLFWFLWIFGGPEGYGERIG